MGRDTQIAQEINRRQILIANMTNLTEEMEPVIARLKRLWKDTTGQTYASSVIGSETPTERASRESREAETVADEARQRMWRGLD